MLSLRIMMMKLFQENQNLFEETNEMLDDKINDDHNRLLNLYLN
jgi:hypothetical protein